VSNLTVADTSVVVPALCAWHEAHTPAMEACRELTALPAHVLLETTSVMTRLPDGLAVTADAVRTALQANFPDRPLALRASEYLTLATLVSEAGLIGGQVYDALVGFTAATAGARLLTRDRRAVATYRAVGVAFELLV
jgi:predicted nucleic acid-binding protein